MPQRALLFRINGSYLTAPPVGLRILKLELGDEVSEIRPLCEAQETLPIRAPHGTAEFLQRELPMITRG